MSKYKVGDYIVAPGCIFKRIVGVITDDSSNPIYANCVPYNRAKDDDRAGGYSAIGTRMVWDTEFELDDDGYAPATPDFKRYSKLEAGDMLLVGDKQDYIKVLARVGEAILLSDIPNTQEAEMVNKLSEQIKELSDGKVDPMQDLMSEDERKKLKQRGTMTYAHKVANIWKTTEWLCLMNWTIVGE